MVVTRPVKPAPLYERNAWTIAETCAQLALSEFTVGKLIATGRLSTIDTGTRRVRITRRSVEALEQCDGATRPIP